MVIVVKSVDPDTVSVNSVGVFLSALGLHNYNRLLALHLQKSTGSWFINFHPKMPLNNNKSQSTYFTKFSGGACPQTPIALACYAC